MTEDPLKRVLGRRAAEQPISRKVRQVHHRLPLFASEPMHAGIPPARRKADLMVGVKNVDDKARGLV